MVNASFGSSDLSNLSSVLFQDIDIHKQKDILQYAEVQKKMVYTITQPDGKRNHYTSEKNLNFTYGKTAGVKINPDNMSFGLEPSTKQTINTPKMFEDFTSTIPSNTISSIRTHSRGKQPRGKTLNKTFTVLKTKTKKENKQTNKRSKTKDEKK